VSLRRSLLVVIALVAGTLAAVAWAHGRPAAHDLSVGAVVRVGVAQGESIPAYVAASRAELPAVSGAGFALVSLSSYVSPARLAPFVRDIAVVAVFARVPLPGTQTEIVRMAAQRVPDDVLAGMASAAARKEREAADFRARGDQDRARVASAEADAYRRSCACVYAVVVRADPEALASVAGLDGVRVVDPAPEVVRLERAVFLPPLPEQTGVARPPQ
jgi:hypothetical protein